MKIVFSEIQHVFDLDTGVVNSLVIENQSLFFRILSDIQAQLNGHEGRTTISEEGEILPFARSVELISQYIPFELSRKSLISRVTESMEKKAVQELYLPTMELMGTIESYLTQLAFELPGDIEFTKICIGSLLKSAGISFCEDYDSLGEKLIDYMELVTEYDREKLFVFVNLRSYLPDTETQLFLDTVLYHHFHVLMIESKELSLLSCEKRYLVDSDGCEIQ